MNAKSFLALFLATVMLLSVFTACADETDGKDTDTEGTSAETESDVKDELPSITYDGEEIRLLIYTTDYTNNVHVFDEISDNVVDLAKYNTVTKIEERFKLNIVEYVESYEYVNNQYRSLIKAGADDYDIIFPDDMHAHYYAEEDLIYDYPSLTYIDLEKDYWDQSLLEYTNIGKNVYYAFGTYDFTYYDLTHCLVFNKDLAASLGCESPYKLVSEGRWTMDAMYEMAKLATYDDGDGEMTVADSYGYVSSSKQILPDFWIAGGTTAIKLDKDNLPYVDIETNERLHNIIDKCLSMFWDGEIWYVSTDQNGNQSANHELLFESEHALFADYTFHYIGQLSDCEADYGIVPFPKYDADQKEYYSRVEAGAALACVPTSNAAPDMAGLLIEAMASTGYQEILPAYYEKALRSRNARDEESQHMLDLVFKTRVYDFADTWYCEHLRDGMFRTMFNENKNNIASYYARYKRMIGKTIDATIEAYTK